MAVFGGLIQTNAGRNLLAKAQTGKVLNFKKIVLGDGQLGSSESIANLTQLKNQVLTCNIAKIQLKQGGITSITFNLSNQDIETGFTWREIGIIAQDPDTEEEVLYCYGNAGENGEYISAGGETDILEKNVSVDLIVSNVENITATIDESLIYASQDDIEELTTLINTKADRTYVDTKTVTVANWIKNTTTGYYEYNIIDTTITANHLVQGNMDLANQAKMTDGYIESYAGGYKIITSELPTEDITMSITIQKVGVAE